MKIPSALNSYQLFHNTSPQQYVWQQFFCATIYIKIKKVIKYLTKLIQKGDRSQCMRNKIKKNIYGKL